MRSLNSEEIKELLAELVSRLIEAGVIGTMHIVGGAAVALRNPNRHKTDDVDAIVRPAAQIIDIASGMAKQFDLRDDWLNDAVHGLIPFVGPEEWDLYFSENGIEISLAKPELLLAMKIQANRGKRDTQDMHYLIELLGLKNLDEIQAIYEKYYAQEVISDLAADRINQYFESLDAEN